MEEAASKPGHKKRAEVRQISLKVQAMPSGETNPSLIKLDVDGCLHAKCRIYTWHIFVRHPSVQKLIEFSYNSDPLAYLFNPEWTCTMKATLVTLFRAFGAILNLENRKGGTL